MKRRQAILVPLTLAAPSLPIGARAQVRDGGKPYRIALVPDLGNMGPGVLKEFTEGLREAGRIEGRDYVLIRSGLEYGPSFDVLVQRALDANPDLILSGGTPIARPIQKFSPTTPVVIWGGGFPIQAGIIDSLSHPGRSVTGITAYADVAIFGKYLQLMQEVNSDIKRIGVIWSNLPPIILRAELEHAVQQFRDAARQLKLDARIIETEGPEDVDAAIAKFSAEHIDALVLPVGRSVNLRMRKLMEFSAQKRLPVLSEVRDFGVDPSPLLSYGPPFPALVRQAAGYVNRILWGGAKPGDLPVQQPTKFELVINLKTAKALGITIPRSLLLRADEVIQ